MQTKPNKSQAIERRTNIEATQIEKAEQIKQINQKEDKSHGIPPHPRAQPSCFNSIKGAERDTTS